MPEIQEHHFSLVIGNVNGFSIGGFHLQFGEIQIGRYTVFGVEINEQDSSEDETDQVDPEFFVDANVVQHKNEICRGGAEDAGLV